MDITKVNWTNSTETVRMAFPIAKVDKEKRTVSGFATLDNVDRHGDVVLPDASEKAFQRFRGNLREMHQPIAVGKVVSFEPQDFYDEGNVYKGIYVDAYISKGAQDTWEKVLDGTLTGFSIGGNIVEAEGGSDGRVIKDYELMELSLVDNPANPLANIFSIQKNADGIVISGMAADVNIENVFWCSGDRVATTSEEDSRNCVVCGDAMSTIGWVEKSDTNKSEIVKKMITGMFTKDDSPSAPQSQNSDSISSQDTINLYPDQNKVKKSIDAESDADESNLQNEGGNENMAEETTVVEADAVEEVSDATVEEVQDEAVEKAATVSELPVDELDFTKMLDNLKADLEAVITKNYAVATDAATEVQKTVTDFNVDIQKSIDDFGSKVTELTNNISDIVKSFDDLAKRVDNLEGATAIRKSADAEPVVADDKKLSKSMWQGHFLPVQAL